MLAIVIALVGLWTSMMPARAQTQASMRPESLAIGNGTKTATAVAGAVTLNKSSGLITTEALTTIAGATYSLTITDTQLTAGTEFVFASVSNGTSTTGQPAIASIKVNTGNCVIVVQNIHASAVFNGTLKIAFMSLKL